MTPVRTSGPLHVVSDAVAVTKVVVTKGNDDRVRAAADLLVEYVRRSTGATLPIVEDDWDGTSADDHDAALVHGGRIIVGAGTPGADRAHLDLLAGLDGDSFVLAPSKGDFVLAGRTSLAVEFAVLEFLETYVGVRWLMPGVDGEDVPTRRDLSVPMVTVRCRPASGSRVMMGMMSPTGLGGASGYEWGRHNRLRSTVEFGHSLWQVLPPAKHAERHPQWYPPGVDLQRRYGWQPRFSDRSTAAAAVDAILAHCEAHPEATSVSLAVNDYSGFHPDDLAPGARNSVGFPDASNAYFGWVNRVAEGVVGQRPGIRFGVLAYHDVLDPPGFDLHPAVVPFITGDRIAWRDPEVGDRGRRLTAAWSRRAHELGWWEYLHGAGYLVPKVQFDQLAVNLRFAADHGVVHHFAETWPDWGGGPQAWVAARLLWDPSLDPYQLLDDWCTRVAGQCGGDHLGSHFRDWERFWQHDALDSPWFTDWRSATRRSDYLRFDDTHYLDTVSAATMRLGRSRLERAAGQTESIAQGNRVRQLRRRWDYYEGAIDYRRDAATTSVPRVPDTDDEATVLLSTMAQRFRDGAGMAQQWRALAPDDAAKRAEQLPTPLDRAGLEPTFGPGSLAALLTWFARTDCDQSRCRDLLDQLAADPLRCLRDRSALVRRAVNGAANLFANPGFESGLDGWDVVEPRQGSIGQSEPTSIERRSPIPGGIVVRGADSGEIAQSIALPPGRYGILIHFWCPATTRRGTLRLLAQPAGRDGGESPTLRSPWTRVTRGAGNADTIEWVFTVPPLTGPGAVTTTRVAVELTTVIEGPSFPSMGCDDRLVINELHLHRLDDPTGAPTADQPWKG